MLPHPLDEGPLVTPIAEDAWIVVPRHHCEKLLEDIVLLIPAVRPKGIVLLFADLTDDHSYEIDEPLLRVALCVQVDPHCAGRHFGCSEHVDRLVTDRQRLKRVVTALAAEVRPLSLASGSEGVCELG